MVISDHAELSFAHPSHGQDLRFVLGRIVGECRPQLQFVERYCRSTSQFPDDQTAVYLLQQPWRAVADVSALEALAAEVEATPADGLPRIF